MATATSAYRQKTKAPSHSPREIELEMLEIIEQTLLGSRGIAALILRPSAKNNEMLAAIRCFVLEDVHPDIAMTDPALYRKLSRLRMELILRGWHHFFKS